MSDLNLSYEDLPVGLRRTPDGANYEVGVVVGDTFLSIGRMGLGHVDDLLGSTVEDHAANAAAEAQAAQPAEPAASDEPASSE